MADKIEQPKSGVLLVAWAAGRHSGKGETQNILPGNKEQKHVSNRGHQVSTGLWSFHKIHNHNTNYSPPLIYIT